MKIDNFEFWSRNRDRLSRYHDHLDRSRRDIAHRVVSDDEIFKSKVLDTDEKFSYTFDKPGSYPYFCSVHPKMTGKVIMQVTPCPRPAPLIPSRSCPPGMPTCPSSNSLSDGTIFQRPLFDLAGQWTKRTWLMEAAYYNFLVASGFYYPRAGDWSLRLAFRARGAAELKDAPSSLSWIRDSPTYWHLVADSLPSPPQETTRQRPNR